MQARTIQWRRFTAPLITSLITLGFLCVIYRLRATEPESLYPETLRIQIRDHAKKTSWAEFTYKWIRQPDFPKGNLFGAHYGTGTLQRQLLGITFALPSGKPLSLPKQSFGDLLNANILHDPTVLRLKSYGMRLDFSCGDGEKTFDVELEWDAEKNILTRRIEKREVGNWESQWSFSKGQWRKVKQRFEKWG